MSREDEPKPLFVSDAKLREYFRICQCVEGCESIGNPAVLPKVIEFLEACAFEGSETARDLIAALGIIR
jgi:hypothetical protein